jgi:8-oxo-dGTP pyrophosphatase MutT (NUDIX family)
VTVVGRESLEEAPTSRRSNGLDHEWAFPGGVVGGAVQGVARPLASAISTSSSALCRRTTARPGGSVEPPEDHEVLDESSLRRHAARELSEETGLDTAPEDLALWVVTRGERRSVGLTYLARRESAAVLRERFAALAAANRALGREPELDQIALVRSPDELADLNGPHVDYLEPIVRRYTEALLHRDA